MRRINSRSKDKTLVIGSRPRFGVLDAPANQCYGKFDPDVVTGQANYVYTRVWNRRLSGFPCKGRFRYANLNLPSNMIANCAFAMAHSRGGILHSFCARFNTRKRSFSALSSVGKWPRARTARRNLAFNDSIAFVV